MVMTEILADLDFLRDTVLGRFPVSGESEKYCRDAVEVGLSMIPGRGVCQDRASLFSSIQVVVVQCASNCGRCRVRRHRKQPEQFERRCIVAAIHFRKSKTISR